MIMYKSLTFNCKSMSQASQQFMHELSTYIQPKMAAIGHRKRHQQDEVLFMIGN